jgi:hypothetical protein
MTYLTPRRVSEPSDDVTVYLVLNDHGQFGIAYDETDPAEADDETIICNFLTGQYGNALRVVAFNTAEGWSRDVSQDIAGELLERTFDSDVNLSEGTKRFIDRHMTPARSGRRHRQCATTPGPAMHCVPVVARPARDRTGGER